MSRAPPERRPVPPGGDSSGPDGGARRGHRPAGHSPRGPTAGSGDGATTVAAEARAGSPIGEPYSTPSPPPDASGAAETKHPHEYIGCRLRIVAPSIEVGRPANDNQRSLIAASTAAPYRSSLVGPTPGTAPRSAIDAGRVRAISANVLS